MTQGPEESLEQWGGGRFMEVAQRALGARVPGQVLQKHTVLRFAMGCQDPRAGRKLIDNPPITVDIGVRRVKTYQLSRQALVPRRRGVHSVSRDGQLSRGDQSRTLSTIKGRFSDIIQKCHPEEHHQGTLVWWKKSQDLDKKGLGGAILLFFYELC